MNDTPFKQCSNNIFTVICLHFLTIWTATQIVCFIPQPGETGMAFMLRAAQEWKNQTGSNPQHTANVCVGGAFFGQAVLAGVHSTVREKPEDDPNILIKPYSDFIVAMAHSMDRHNFRVEEKCHTTE